MLRWFLFSSLIVFVLFSCISREKTVGSGEVGDTLNAEVDSEDAREDLRTYKKILDAAHPSINEYIPKDQWNHEYDSIYATIEKGITMREFYNKLFFLLNEIGCCHSLLELPESIRDSYYYSELFFPIPVILLEDGLYCNTDNELPPGSKILSINNVSVDKILDSLMMYSTVDGLHRESQRYIAASTFGIDYFIRFGGQSYFNVSYVDTSGNKHGRIINASTLGDLYNRKSELYYYDAVDVPYSFQIDEESKMGILRVASFNNDTYNQRAAFRNFLDNTFELLKYKKHITHLMIDLRENGGGKLNSCYQLFSYLTDRNFREYDSVFSRIREVPFASLISDKITPGLVYDVNENLKSEFFNVEPRGCCIPDSLIEDWDPKNNRFTGKVYVVVNANVASSASYFAALVKNSGRGVIIGTETSGGGYTGNGFEQLIYTLPRTKINVQFPYAKLIYVKEKVHDGHGVVPDYKVPDNLRFFQRNDDRQLFFIKDSLISKKG
jgi:hypothetical protein